MQAMLRSMAATPAYWFCMYAASALGTNLGDFSVDELGLGRGWSFVSLALISAVAIWADRRLSVRAEAGYWIAIVALRAAATTVADAMTHDLRWSYGISAVALAVATLVAGWFTRVDVPLGRRRGDVSGLGAATPAPRGPLPQGALDPPPLDGGVPRRDQPAPSPIVDGRYWIAMLIAGIFGTVAGDFASHSIGLFPAAGLLGAVLVGLLVLRGSLGLQSLTVYWCVILAERCAGTSAGDSLASHRGAGFGLPLAIACTGGALLLGLLVRNSQPFARRSFTS